MAVGRGQLDRTQEESGRPCDCSRGRIGFDGPTGQNAKSWRSSAGRGDLGSGSGRRELALEKALEFEEFGVPPDRIEVAVRKDFLAPERRAIGGGEVGESLPDRRDGAMAVARDRSSSWGAPVRA